MTNSNVTVIYAIITALIVGGVTLTTTTVGDESSAPPLATRIDELRTARIETLQTVADMLTVMYRSGNVDRARLYAALDALIVAKLDVARTPEARLPLLKQHLDLAKSNEHLAKVRSQDGTGSQVDYLQAKALRMQREIALLSNRDE